MEPEVGIEPTTCCLQVAVKVSARSRRSPSHQGFRTGVSRTVPPLFAGSTRFVRRFVRRCQVTSMADLVVEP